jgi:L-seryl-tRNA(Ser) seleniumtransferase
VEVYSEVGGGSFPDVVIPSYGLAFMPHHMTVETLEARLRNLAVPIVGRIEKERLLFDMRTILREEEPLVLSGLETALKNGQ